MTRLACSSCSSSMSTSSWLTDGMARSSIISIKLEIWKKLQKWNSSQVQLNFKGNLDVRPFVLLMSNKIQELLKQLIRKKTVTVLATKLQTVCQLKLTFDCYSTSQVYTSTSNWKRNNLKIKNIIKLDLHNKTLSFNDKKSNDKRLGNLFSFLVNLSIALVARRWRRRIELDHFTTLKKIKSLS